MVCCHAAHTALPVVVVGCGLHAPLRNMRCSAAAAGVACRSNVVRMRLCEVEVQAAGGCLPSCVATPAWVACCCCWTRLTPCSSEHQACRLSAWDPSMGLAALGLCVVYVVFCCMWP